MESREDDDDSASRGHPNLKDLRSRDSHNESDDVINPALNLHSIFETEANCLKICGNQDGFEEMSKTGRWIPNPEIEIGERRRKAWQFATQLRRQQTGKRGTLFKKAKEFLEKDRYYEGGTPSREETRAKTFHSYFFIAKN